MAFCRISYYTLTNFMYCCTPSVRHSISCSDVHISIPWVSMPPLDSGAVHALSGGISIHCLLTQWTSPSSRQENRTIWPGLVAQGVGLMFRLSSLGSVNFMCQRAEIFWIISCSQRFENSSGVAPFTSNLTVHHKDVNKQVWCGVVLWPNTSMCLTYVGPSEELKLLQLQTS